ncbi:hypothetical protein BCD49_07200 [Pseudofrankia sp. EUN1h]|nr:hypothetical protein BCD49_07200 [Pseudofrankia sp. EUN1h]
MGLGAPVCRWCDLFHRPFTVMPRELTVRHGIWAPVNTAVDDRPTTADGSWQMVKHMDSLS